MVASQSLSFRSPVTKLLRFFRWSRDNWKAKCKAAKRENKSLKTRLIKMRESRDRWKARAQEVGDRDADGLLPSTRGQKGHRRRSGRGTVSVT